MTNLAKARSHIIFIVALLTAAAYILWVEQSRGLPLAKPERANGWLVDIGPFADGISAGQAWQQIPANQGEARLVRTREGVLLRLERLTGGEQAEEICRLVRQRSGRCLISQPAS